MSEWYSVYCSDCGTEIRVHQDWSNPPSICKSCRDVRAAQWYDKSCEDCGTTMKIHRDWSNPPRICKACKAARDAKWYDRPCEDCGTAMRICRDWDNPPRICKSCREKRAAKWYELSCKSCGKSIKAHQDWDHAPTFCGSCRREYAPKDKNCDHCGKSFSIPTGTQIKCRQNGWELPRKCEDCRELFKHKPFKTVREETLFGNTVFRTYNSKGQLISESRDETTIFGNKRRRHTGKGEKPRASHAKRRRFLERRT